jgi:uncharacterized protein
MKAAAITGMAGLGLLLSEVAALAQPGPTFDCGKAEHETESLICQDEELAAKDRKLAGVYSQAIAAMEEVDAGGQEAIRELKTMQRGWIGGRNDCWMATDKRQCAIDSYDRRTAYLQERYFRVEGSKPVYYACSDNSQIIMARLILPRDLPTCCRTVSQKPRAPL